MTTREISLIILLAVFIFALLVVKSNEKDANRKLELYKEENEDLRNQLRPNGFVCRNSNGVAFDYAELHRLNFENKDLRLYNDVKTKTIKELNERFIILEKVILEKDKTIELLGKMQPKTYDDNIVEYLTNTVNELQKKCNTLDKDNNELIDRIALLSSIGKINTEAVKLYDRQYVVGDRFTMTLPPCNGKILMMKNLQQQHFEDIVSKMKSEVEERIMSEGKCEDTERKVEKPICGEDLLDTYEDRKDVVQMFRYFTGYGKDIKALMDFLECKVHEVDLIEGWMTFKEEMNDIEFKVNNGDCIVLTNHRDVSVMTYRDFTSKYTKKES